MDGVGVGEYALEGQDSEFWRSFLRWSQRIRTAVNRAVTAAADLNVPEFEVLDRVYAAPGQEISQLNLTTELGWSASRMSHSLTRLEERAFITREDLGRGRARTVRLTGEGERHLLRGLDAHGRAVREALLDRLGPEQRAMLAALMDDVDHRDRGAPD